MSAPASSAPAEILRACGVGMRLIDGRPILGPVDFDVPPASLTALLGPSGSGKTTLLRSLAGIVDPTDGTVSFGDDPASQRVFDLGYVPQHETVHPFLTVIEALRYAAILRLDAREDAGMRAAQILDELDLVEQAHTLVKDLSGGERRRAACGLELVGHPSVLLLDEPTSGLDPVLERRLMLLFRRLADEGRAVVVATHATASLELCDHIAVMNGGELTLAATPGDAVDRLRVAAGDEPEPVEGRPAPIQIRADTAGKRPFGLEYLALTRRYATTVLRDTRTLAVLIGQAPVIGLVIAVLFRTGALGSRGPIADIVQYGFLLVTGALWLGITSSCREIIKERAIVEREFDVGLRADAYVLAKTTVLFAFSAVQVLLMLLVVLAIQSPHIDARGVVTLSGLTVLTAWTSVGLGLVVSALARTVDQAAGVIPLVLMPQLAFAGAVVPLDRMPGVASLMADLSYSRWAFSAVGSVLNIDDRFAAQPEARDALGFGQSFFAHAPGGGAAALLAFIAAFLTVCTITLYWRPPGDEH